MRAIVYIDGFDLYYGLLRHSPHKWLDLEKFVKALLTDKYEVFAIKYFAARVTKDADDPDAAIKQQQYLEALKSLVFNPHEGMCHELRRFSTFCKNIPRELPSQCRLPDEVHVGKRIVTCPLSWRDDLAFASACGELIGRRLQ